MSTTKFKFHDLVETTESELTQFRRTIGVDSGRQYFVHWGGGRIAPHIMMTSW